MVFLRISSALYIPLRALAQLPRVPTFGAIMSATLLSLDGQDDATLLREIHNALRDLRFGSVEITVHNGQVVQIERKEKFRLQHQPGKPA